MLLAGSGSAAAELTLIVLFAVAGPAGAFTVIAEGRRSAERDRGRRARHCADSAEHVQPVPLPLTNVASAGNVSVTVPFGPACGPAFEISTV